MDEKYKEVFFYKYCKTCKHEKTKETKDPCNECLGSIINYILTSLLSGRKKNEILSLDTYGKDRN